jgi:4-amino-4-deoxy-L-arabinose transferase-like glycosyltransferase
MHSAHTAGRSWFRDPAALTVGVAVLALHLALANRYDVFRDELYFIVCGRHPAFGYVDQPPLVPLLAAGTYALGAQTWLLRLPAVLAAGGLVWLTVAFTRLLGGRGGAAWIAAIAAGCAPMFMGLTGTLNTTTFEPLAWTAVAYALALTALRDDRRALLWGGAVAGVALEAKYALATWLVALALGVALTAERRLFARKELWLGLGIMTLLAAPSIVWQALHGWPFAELVAAARAKDADTAPLAFVLNQIVLMNPLLAPVWLAGIVAPFAWSKLVATRFLAIAFVAQLGLTIATHGKDYYLAAAYPTVFALGAIAWERIVGSAAARAAYLGLAAAISALIAPIALPILPPPTLAVYMRVLHLAPQAQEKAAAQAVLPQMFSDELGWRDFVREVAAAYDAIPPAQRGSTAILAGNYGEAGAIDVYGAAYGLPPALAGHNQYYLWGLRGQRPSSILRVSWESPASLRRFCSDVRVLGLASSPYAMPYENAVTFTYCAGLRPSLATLWPHVKFYQ